MEESKVSACSAQRRGPCSAGHRRGEGRVVGADSASRSMPWKTPDYGHGLGRYPSTAHSQGKNIHLQAHGQSLCERCFSPARHRI